MLWKIVYWLNLAPELFSENGDEDRKKPDSKKKNLFSSFTDASKPSSSNKSLFIKLFAATTVLVFGYFTFLHGKYYDITVKTISCSDSNLTIESQAGHKYVVDPKQYHEIAYAEKLSNNGNETVHKIYLKTDSWNVAFNIAESIHTSENKSHSIYKLDNGQHIKWGCIDGSGTCSTATTGCCSGTGAGTSCCGTGSSSCNGTNCACCCLGRIASFAILHPLSPNRFSFTSLLINLLPSLLFLGLLSFMMRGVFKQQMGLYGKNSIFKIGKSLSQTNKSNITFKDVAGLAEEKEELEEIVDYLKHPQKYNSMGARTPKGVILYGPPGTGKTMLAKAVSGEADVPFLEASGASFDDMFVGVGAKRVRELFDKAKKLAPCIIFIDEIDALAGKRSEKYSMGATTDQTINQLLSEMDGFNTNTGIVIIGATNRLNNIDDAILRPGRFDRHVMINLPDIAERIQILNIHARNKNISSSVDLEDIARKTPGFSGAQLENVLNEATLLTVRSNKLIIGTAEILESIDRVMAGPAKKNRKISDAERQQIAYHEAGHAIAGMYAKEGDVVEKITIVARGKAAGYVLSAPEKEENILKTKKQLLSMIVTTLAGRAAEEIIFGEEKISSGASNDLYKATAIVKNMVVKYGMSKKLGLIQYVSSESDENPYKNSYSEAIAKQIDLEIKSIVDKQYLKAKEIIEEHRDEYQLIVDTLLILETIDKKQIQYIHEKKQMPVEAIKAKERMIQKEKERAAQALLEVEEVKTSTEKREQIVEVVKPSNNNDDGSKPN